MPAALRVAKGGTVVCAGIHMSDVPSFPYELLCERVLRSIANLTRRDGEEFLELAPSVPVRTEVEAFPLEAANEALDRLRAGRILAPRSDGLGLGRLEEPVGNELGDRQGRRRRRRGRSARAGRADCANRKSSTSVPSGRRACGRIPAGAGSRSRAVSSGR